MPAVSPLLLAVTVRQRHGCNCAVLGSVWVAEPVAGERPWIGRVWLIELLGHPRASLCFAWGLPVEGTRRFDCVTVLAQSGVRTPAEAVRLHLKARGAFQRGGG